MVKWGSTDPPFSMLLHMTKAKPLPPLATVADLLSYNPETGQLLWKVTSGPRPAGTDAGTTDAHGYRVVQIQGSIYKCHRLAWLLFHGLDPVDMEIDHVNGNPKDNRLCNLRLSSKAENQRNRGAQLNSTTGLKGVSKKRNRWVAQIKVNGEKRFLGSYLDPHSAHAAYAQAAEQWHGAYARAA